MKIVPTMPSQREPAPALPLCAERNPDLLRCGGCGREIFRANRIGPIPKWCSRACAVAHWPSQQRKTPSQFTCQRCGVLVEAGRYRSRYCSEGCRLARKTPAQIACQVCGEVVGAATKKNFCSEACKRYADNRAARCSECEKPISRGSKLCASHSQSARQAVQRAVEILCPLNWRVCRECGVEWLGAKGARGPRLCKECAAALNRGKAREYYHRVSRGREGVGQHIIACVVCGETFVGTGNRKFCSRQCHRRSPSERAARRKREAIKRGASGAERIVPAEIYARDKYRCGICGKKISMNEHVPHPLSPTIDHVLPLSEGGPHVSTNVRAAHFRCNSLRSNRGEAQLRMV